MIEVVYFKHCPLLNFLDYSQQLAVFAVLNPVYKAILHIWHSNGPCLLYFESNPRDAVIDHNNTMMNGKEDRSLRVKHIEMMYLSTEAHLLFRFIVFVERAFVVYLTILHKLKPALVVPKPIPSFFVHYENIVPA